MFVHVRLVSTCKFWEFACLNALLDVVDLMTRNCCMHLEVLIWNQVGVGTVVELGGKGTDSAPA